MKPSQILSKLCKEGKIDPPVYNRGKVTVGKHNFVIKQEEIDQCDFSKGTIIIIHPSPPPPVRERKTYFYPLKILTGIEEQVALSILQKWQEIPRIGCQLVPEHIETRPLYNPDRPSIEQVLILKGKEGREKNCFFFLSFSFSKII